ncbi:MAG: hypothetical protein QGG36_08290 [Pirellulaceae bacterium]|jgi:hypothetical protein|nr:hypothetical protein [Pirellulaceae bacterium]MDP7015783.1 hypothetical protein [Pirellulaceae bacterium]
MLDKLDLFFGDANDTLAHVYARLPETADRGHQLGGSIYGPFSSRSTTLPARAPLTPVEPGDSPLARAVVPDPCFWSPALPQWYEATVTLHGPTGQLAENRQLFGMQPRGVRRGRIWATGERWTVCAAATAGPIDWGGCSAANRAVLAASPDDEMCAAATRAGVRIVAEIPAAVEALRRVSRWPAVSLVIVPADSSVVAGDLRRAAPNQLLAATAPAAAWENGLTTPWAHAAVAEIVRGDEIPTAAVEQPIIIRLRDDTSTTPAEQADALDQLRRRAAARGQFAGFLIG